MRKTIAVLIALAMTVGVVIILTVQAAGWGERGSNFITEPAAAIDSPPPATGSRSITIGGPTVEWLAAVDLQKRTIEYAKVVTDAKPKVVVVKPKPQSNSALPPAPEVQVSGGGVNAFLACVAKYESGSNYSSHTANGSGGMYGFLTSTFQRGGWAARYGVTYPYQATPAQQDQMAMELYASSGSRPWSTRGRCGG